MINLIHLQNEITTIQIPIIFKLDESFSSKLIKIK